MNYGDDKKRFKARNRLEQKSRIVGVDSKGKAINYNNRSDLEYIYEDDDLNDVEDDIDLESVHIERDDDNDVQYNGNYNDDSSASEEADKFISSHGSYISSSDDEDKGGGRGGGGYYGSSEDDDDNDCTLITSNSKTELNGINHQGEKTKAEKNKKTLLAQSLPSTPPARSKSTMDTKSSGKKYSVNFKGAQGRRQGRGDHKHHVSDDDDDNDCTLITSNSKTELNSINHQGEKMKAEKNKKTLLAQSLPSTPPARSKSTMDTESSGKYSVNFKGAQGRRQGRGNHKHHVSDDDDDNDCTLITSNSITAKLNGASPNKNSIATNGSSIKNQEGKVEEKKKKVVPSSPSPTPTTSTATSTSTSTIIDTNSARRRHSLNLNIDDEIINSVLKKSKQRSNRLKRSESLKKLFPYKCWKRVIASMAVLFGATAVALGTLFCYIYITTDDLYDYIGVTTETDGSMFLYDDHDDFHQHDDYDFDLHHVLDQPIAIAVGSFPEHIKTKAKNADERPSHGDSRSEVPLFWKLPHSGDVMESIMTKCFGFTLASDVISDKIPIIQSNPDELVVYNVDNGFFSNGEKYVNVDLSEREGIEVAASLGLVGSGLADIISSEELNIASDLLFDGVNTKAHLFTMLRHPVDQTIMSYYSFMNSLDESSELQLMTLQEYIESPFMDSNRLTHFLANVGNLRDPVDREHLNLAKEVLRRKFLVGLYEVLDDSVELFARYFGWNETVAMSKRCVANHITESFTSTRGIHKKFAQNNYKIQYGSDIYNAIVLKNVYDMDLYWYAFDLHKARQLWINPPALYTIT